MNAVARLESDTVDVGDVVSNVRRGWPVILGGIVLGLIVAAAVILFVPARFNATSTVIDHATESVSSSLRTKLTGSIAGAAADLLPGGLGASSPVETDIQVLSSRTLAGEAVDSLDLQVRVRGPRRIAARQLFASASFPGAFKRRSVHFERAANGQFSASTGGNAVAMSPGVAASVAGGTVTLAGTNVPPAFDVYVYDREEAITRFQSHLSIEKAGGEVISVAFSADDSLTAAAVPNLLVRRYLQRRRTSDRGVNQRRVEFLSVEADSVEQALRAAEQALRQQQEASGVVDPVVVGKLELERAGDLRKDAGTLDVERGAIKQMLDQLAQGDLTSRQLAAFPSFLKSQGINDLLSQLSTLETKRLQLLATFTPQDPSVAALTEAIHNIEAQLPPLAREYLASLDRERAIVTKQLDTLSAAIAQLPATGESGLRRQRNVLQLGQINAAVQGQLVEARLAAIGEGGDVRPLDIAEPPRRVSFPQPRWTFPAGAVGGLLLGVIAALFAGSFGRYVSDARTIERQIGVPALTLDPRIPFVLSGFGDARTLLLVPLDQDADTAGVAERLMRTAMSRSLRATVIDFSEHDDSTPAMLPNLQTLSSEFELVVVQLPELASDTTVGALRSDRPVMFVASAGRVDRRELSMAVDSLSRLSVPCAGVVLSRQTSRQTSRQASRRLVTAG